MDARDTVVVNEEPGDETEKGSQALATSTRSLAGAYTASMPKSWGISIDQIMPTLDVSRYVPKIDASLFSSVIDTELLRSQAAASIGAVTSMITAADFMPKLDFSEAWASVGASSVLKLMDSAELLKQYSLAESFVMPDIKGFDSIAAGAIAQINEAGQLLQPVLEQFRGIDWEEVLRRQSLPNNWSRGTEARLEVLVEMVGREGIPAAWVPRAEVLEALLDAAPGDERSELLIARREEILDDCAGWIDDLQDDFLEPVLPVAREVLDACRSGHWRVAAISAVIVVHNVVEALHWVSDRQRVAKHHSLTMDTPYPELLERATRAPLVPFYADWNPKSGQPRPAHVTRHVVSHHLDADQVTERNCIVAVMLMSSLLVTVYQLELGEGERAA
ncbi:hypothetical protein [Agromyces italicus]|uniref:hypothetical protein n=1 Tax=Agromyces italicus TaxID=279572 RepID=UPI0012FB5ED2|nr:hypothetical protein [Agromyces italicus]